MNQPIVQLSTPGLTVVYQGIKHSRGLLQNVQLHEGGSSVSNQQIPLGGKVHDDVQQVLDRLETFITEVNKV